MVVFQSYVSLPEGTHVSVSPNNAELFLAEALMMRSWKLRGTPGGYGLHIDTCSETSHPDLGNLL